MRIQKGLFDRHLLRSILHQTGQLQTALGVDTIKFRETVHYYLYDVLQFYYTLLETHPSRVHKQRRLFEKFMELGEEVSDLLRSIRFISETDFIELQSRLEQMETIQNSSFLNGAPSIRTLLNELQKLAHSYHFVEHTLDEVTQIEDYL
jgi:hypothetical protein